MAYSSKRNEYNAKYTQEHYVRTNGKIDSETHLKITKIARENGLTNSDLIRLGIKLLDENLLQEYVEKVKGELHQKSKNGVQRLMKSFVLSFKKKEIDGINYKLKEKYNLSFGIVAKATALYLENKKDY